MKLLIDLIMFLAPFLIAQLVVDLGEWLQKLSPWLDARGPMVKRLVIAVMAFLLFKGSATLGVALGTDMNALLGGNLGALQPTDVGSLLTAGLSYLFHNSNQTKKAVTPPAAHDPGA